MKLTHAGSGQTIEVQEDHSDRYLQQGWELAGTSSTAAAPAGNASLADWQDYARTQGYSEADLEGKTRADLRAALA